MDISPEQLKELGLNQDKITESLIKSVHRAYEEKEKEIGEETLRQIEKFIMLQGAGGELQAQQLFVILNFTEDLKRLAPPGN